MTTPSRQRDVRFLALDIGRSKPVGAHSHATHQLLTVQRGALALTHARSSWVVPTGGSAWLPAGLRHELEGLGDATVSALYVRARPEDRYTGPGPVTITPLLATLIVTLSRPVIDPERRKRLEHVVRDELADLKPWAFIVAVPFDAMARRVAAELLADPTDNRSLGQLAAAAGTSARTLQRRFREQTGLPFHTWRRRAGLQHAMTLLDSGNSITGTAHRCGFSSASAFIAAFRAELGTTPGAWRRADAVAAATT